MLDEDDIKAIDIKEPKEKIQDNNYNKKIDKLNDTINDSEKNNIYIFIEEGKKYLYSFHKVSKEKNYYEIRCKDRNCNGRAKIN